MPQSHGTIVQRVANVDGVSLQGSTTDARYYSRAIISVPLVNSQSAS